LSLYRIPEIFRDFPEVVAAESTRNGGFSKGSFHSLNLGLYTDDNPGIIKKNRALFARSLGFEPGQLAGSYQVHGDEILKVKKAGNYHSFDALISCEKGILLTVTVADCVPVLIFDTKHQAIAAIHAGWRSTQKRIVEKTLHRMQMEWDTKPLHCLAYVGTCIGESVFEVDVDVADYFAPEFKHWDSKRQKFLINLKAVNKDQLLRSGVPETQIEISPFCTVLDNENYFSFRKEGGKTGRMLGVIGMLSV